jgi:hypothetical protein
MLRLRALFEGANGALIVGMDEKVCIVKAFALEKGGEKFNGYRLQPADVTALDFP